MNKIIFGDCRESMRQLAAEGVKVRTCVTSPPYFGLRDYGVDGQLGLEQSPDQYVASMVEVFRCVRDVLADDGTLWLNIGDSYARNPGKGGSGPFGKNRAYSDSYSEAQIGKRSRPKSVGAGNGIKEKDLIGIPWMLAFALRADGWYLRQDIIWHKPNVMPESVRDRPTKAHEYVFLFSKSERYFYDHEAVKEPAVYADCGRPSKKRGEFEGKNLLPGKEAFRAIRETRNRRSVWTVATKPYKGAHFATFPPALIEPCILAGSRPGDIVLDPFMGSGTTAAVAIAHGRQYVGCDLNPGYKAMQDERIAAAIAAKHAPAAKPLRPRRQPEPVCTPDKPAAAADARQLNIFEQAAA